MDGGDFAVLAQHTGWSSTSTALARCGSWLRVRDRSALDQSGFGVIDGRRSSRRLWFDGWARRRVWKVRDALDLVLVLSREGWMARLCCWWELVSGSAAVVTAVVRQI